MLKPAKRMLVVSYCVKFGNTSMSRIGKKAITIPSGVTVTIGDSAVVVKGPKGELQTMLQPGITVAQESEQLVVARKDDEPSTKAFHGLVRSLIENTVVGVTEGYKKTLKLVGTGYRVAAKGQGLSLSVGFSHQVDVVPRDGVTFSVEGNDTIHIEGIDKQVVGQAAADIRAVRPPEPYKGKGIRYSDEEVSKKPGKAVTK